MLISNTRNEMQITTCSSDILFLLISIKTTTTIAATNTRMVSITQYLVIWSVLAFCSSQAIQSKLLRLTIEFSDACYIRCSIDI